MDKSKSERDIALEKVKQRKARKKSKEEILSLAKKEVKEIETVENLSNIMPVSKTFIQNKMDQARLNIKNGIAVNSDIGFTEENGIEFCDPNEFYVDEELKRHGNDPNIRLDECGFPEDRTDRTFLLKHNFDGLLETVNDIEFSWIYLYGDSGRGKTSFATRIVWELIKNKPLERATFLSIGKWTDSLRVGKEEYLPLSSLRRIVVVDDFDKFDQQKSFQIRQLLILVEELKNRHLVIFTSNYSREEIGNLNPKSLDLEVMLDRVKGKSIDFPRFEGESYR